MCFSSSFVAKLWLGFKTFTNPNNISFQISMLYSMSIAWTIKERWAWDFFIITYYLYICYTWICGGIFRLQTTSVIWVELCIFVFSKPGFGIFWIKIVPSHFHLNQCRLSWSVNTKVFFMKCCTMFVSYNPILVYKHES